MVELNDYHPFFNQIHPISEEDFALFCQHLKPKEAKKGSFLLAPGEVQKTMYLVRDGVQMSFYESEKNLHVMAFTYAPSFCAIPESFSLQQESKAYLQCLTDSSFWSLSFDELQEIFSQSRALETLFRKMTEHVLAGIIERHVQLHSSSIEERFTQFCQRSAPLLHVIPHKYIASYLHIDPTNFSKLFNRVKF
ncbi:MAG: Crp/Fnr family transcriptional regulator [Bacteroidota bacterium]|nr:Crp/Fnr family transcriptional regulator [Bacteroidota bacterium]MDX5430721.1 Crp/Fnr family transcriptional regulator [Bacteroidota bacterium]MDX5469468.1 Crp/Fnr family transcriptional regulator [Bacteroidota bacterium]